MPRVTIGVPVYNSENLLEQCLANLAAQTYPDFKVIILDNASTDRTGDIAQRFAARDPRFVYRRQPHNKGARQNFADVLALADTPYFMWRADDDGSDVNFVEEMVRLLDAHPSTALAVGLSVLDKRGRRRRKPFPQRLPAEPVASYRVRVLLASRAAWMFGLFRTEQLRENLARVLAGYPHVYGFDHLVLFPFLITLRVVGTDKSAFVTGFIERPTSAKKGSLLDPGRMTEIRRDFLSYCLNEATRLLGSGQAAALRPFLTLYAEHTYRLLKILRARVRLLAGERPFGATTKYD
jgi:glycosyltransferase involved in cell wall biosynthesis